MVLLEIRVFCDVVLCGRCFKGPCFEGSTVFRNVGKYSPKDTVARVRNSDSSRGKFLLLPRKKSLFLDLPNLLLLLLSSGPRAYAPDAPQPIDLLCNPSVFKRSHLCCQSAFSSVLPERPLAVKGGTTTWARKMADNFA